MLVLLTTLAGCAGSPGPKTVTKEVVRLCPSEAHWPELTCEWPGPYTDVPGPHEAEPWMVEAQRYRDCVETTERQRTAQRAGCPKED